MVLNIVMSALSAALEWLFLGVFRWGIWAAALGTCLGMMFCAVIALIPFARGKMLLRFCRPHLSRKMLGQIFSCGTPNFLNNIAGRLTSIIMNAILVRLGGQTAVSVYGVLMYADGFIQPLLYGMCDSLQPAVGYNWGAGTYSRVRAIERCCYAASAVVSLLAVVVVAGFPQFIAGLFMPDAAGEALEMVLGALRLFSLTYFFRWFSFATQSYMLAIEKSLPASIISVSTALIFPVLLIAALWPLGLTGIWLNFAGTAVLSGVLALVVLLRSRSELMQADRPVQAQA